MGESLLLITIITLVVLTIRRARPVVLETPVTIQRPGQYMITLAPQLNRAQTFIEQIAKQFGQLHRLRGDLPTQYFEIRDPKVFTKGASSYLLAITLRGGMLYFQAVNPGPAQDDVDTHYEVLSAFSDTAMQHHPLTEPAEEGWAEKLGSSVAIAAEQYKIRASSLK